MTYVLFLMFLITPPGQNIPKPDRLYTLQSTQSVEFDLPEACVNAQLSIAESVKVTDTILLVSSCLPKGTAKTTESLIGNLPAVRSQKKLQAPKVKGDGIIRFAPTL